MRNVLFLCTHNSARSILAEALLNHLSRQAPTQRWQAWSAGSSPRPGQQPHPLALEVLRREEILQLPKGEKLAKFLYKS